MDIRGKTFKNPYLAPPERTRSARSTHRQPGAPGARFGAATISLTVVI
jgi:hypothetical protein